MGDALVTQAPTIIIEELACVELQRASSGGWRRVWGTHSFLVREKSLEFRGGR